MLLAWVPMFVAWAAVFVAWVPESRECEDPRNAHTKTRTDTNAD